MDNNTFKQQRINAPRKKATPDIKNRLLSIARLQKQIPEAGWETNPSEKDGIGVDINDR